MALIMIDGFSHYASTDMGHKWSGYRDLGQVGVVAGAGRGGRGAYYGGAIGAGIWTTFTGRATLVMGFAHQTTGGNAALMAFGAGNDSTVLVMLNGDGSISAYRRTGISSVALLGSSAPAVASTSGAWDYLEFKAFCHPTSGAVEIRVNGTAVLTVNNVNTDYGGFGAFSMASLLGWTSGPTTSTTGVACDFYLADTSGTRNNDFLGDCKVETLRPNRDGAVQQFTPSTAAPHFGLVDDTTYSAADYVTGTAAGQTELLGFPAISGNPLLIHGVQVVATGTKTDAGSRTVDTVAAVGGTQHQRGQLTQLRVGAACKMGVFDANPATGLAWQKTELAAAEFGLVTGA